MKKLLLILSLVACIPAQAAEKWVNFKQSMNVVGESELNSTVRFYVGKYDQGGLYSSIGTNTETIKPHWDQLARTRGVIDYNASVIINGNYQSGRMVAGMTGWALYFDNPRAVLALVKASKMLDVTIEGVKFKFTGNGAVQAAINAGIN